MVWGANGFVLGSGLVHASHSCVHIVVALMSPSIMSCVHNDKYNVSGIYKDLINSCSKKNNMLIMNTNYTWSSGPACVKGGGYGVSLMMQCHFRGGGGRESRATHFP